MIMSVFLLMTLFQLTFAAPGQNVGGENNGNDKDNGGSNGDGGNGGGNNGGGNGQLGKGETPFLPCPPICEPIE